ncbi:MAG TPA: EMC3/TMCO1 family protein [Thermoplasmata archaeon]|nr:EMC3/TMCO1 family protein [Thermoplasmata archaeon]
MSGGKGSSGTPLPSSAEADEEESAPLPEEGAESEESAEAETATAEEEAPAPKPARPPPPAFKVSTFVYIFLGLLGLWMLIDQSARNSIACALGMVNSGACPTGTQPWGLYWLIGFNSNYLLLTMALAGALEMLVTSLAYNFTTDWVKAAKVQKWSSAFRKVQMEAIRSGKKDRIAALKPHQERLTRLSSEVSIAQFKGMAITYFLLILIYTWVGLVIGGANSVQQTIALGTGSTINLSGHIGTLPIPWWFVIFSVYTLPFSLVFRRLLKHVWLRRHEERKNAPPPASETVGGSA